MTPGQPYSAAAARTLRDGRPFVGIPGASRLFGGRWRRGSPRLRFGESDVCSSRANASAAPLVLDDRAGRHRGPSNPRAVSRQLCRGVSFLYCRYSKTTQNKRYDKITPLQGEGPRGYCVRVWSERAEARCWKSSAAWRTKSRSSFLGLVKQ